MAKCEVKDCNNEAISTIEELSIAVCEWHQFAHANNVGWLGKTDEDAIENTIPKPKEKGLT